MIIVSQDETKIINFERINYIQLSKVDNRKSVIEINYSDCNWQQIAEYKTEERAKGVLQEIIKMYDHAEHIKCNKSFTIPNIIDFVYEMPRE